MGASGLTFCLHVLSLRSFPNVDSEHHYLWSHGGHFVAEAELIRSVHVSCESVFSTGFSVAFVNAFVIRACDLKARRKGNGYSSMHPKRNEAYLWNSCAKRGKGQIIQYIFQ